MVWSYLLALESGKQRVAGGRTIRRPPKIARHQCRASMFGPDGIVFATPFPITRRGLANWN